jgi:glycerol-3-phosphate acyltransferase PlsY
VIALAWLAGSIPFSNIAARRRAGVDLRDVGGGTVSGTALHGVAGFGPLAVAGVCDIAKGAVGPLVAGRDRPVLAAVAGAAGVAGHNWSPWLGGAGGRGISVAMGSFLAHNWPGTVVLAAGLAGGRLCRQTGLGSFVAAVALTPVLATTRGRTGAVAGASVAALLVAKRVAGNRRPTRPDLGVYVHRLLYDHDPDDPVTHAGGTRTRPPAQTAHRRDGAHEGGAPRRVGGDGTSTAAPGPGRPSPSGPQPTSTSRKR